MNPKPLEVAKLTEKFLSILQAPRLILFAGSGVSARAGLPTWGDYLDHLAGVCERYDDKASAILIREKVQASDFLGAASIYKLCNRIPTGIQNSELALPFNKAFSPEQLSPLEPLIECGFSAVVTTNYDRVLHNTYSKVTKESPLHLHLDDETIRNAAQRSDFFIARIHGRCEKPESIILDAFDYRQLVKNDCYLDFLLDLLAHRPCIFLGFSFVDPAIKQILEIFKAKKGPNYPTLHYAILPAESGAELGQLLAQLNISVFYYDEKERHKELWQAIRATRDKIKLTPKEAKKIALPPMVSAPFSRFMAFTYAQMRSATDQNPVLETVQEGLILSLIDEKKESSGDDAYLVEGVRQALNIDFAQAEGIVSSSCSRLLATKEIIRSAQGLKRAKTDALPLKSHIRELAERVAERFKVRELKRLSQEAIGGVERILERLFLVRAWDLAAHYAGGGAGYAADLPAVVFSLVREGGDKVPQFSGLAETIYDLLSSPTDLEAVMLAELGRCALAVQLVLSSPRQTLFQRHVLPETIYLDSNILLPLIVDGHPFRPAYTDAFSRLEMAARLSGTSCKIIVAAPFLNEVISHRRIADQLAKELKLDDHDRLWEHITYYGASNTNVFIGAFSNHVGRQNSGLKFSQFLKKAAPYENEKELEIFILKQGITCLHLDYNLRHSPEKAGFVASLIQGYEETKKRQLELKETILIEHEAEQLLLLQQDADRHRRSIFITADMQLQAIVRRTKLFSQLSSSTVSQLGFMGMVDIMVGLNADKRSLARMMWAVPRTDSQHQVRDYLIARVLKEYDAALASAMHKVIDKIVDETVATAKKERINLAGGDRFEDVARTAKFLDRYEEKFFKLMGDELEKQK